MTATARRYSWFARLPEPARGGVLVCLRPVVLPVWAFVDRWYFTAPQRRLARVRGLITWWRLFAASDNPRPRLGDARTADELIDQLEAVVNE